MGASGSTEEKRKEKERKPLTQEERVRIDQMFSDLVREMKKHGLPDVVALRNAYNFALKVHGDTRRKTGDPYITHPLSVAMILAEIGHETDVIVSAILHDVVEDCNVTVEQLEEEFGSNVADMVNAVTKESRKLSGDPEISPADLDDLSDRKFRAEIQKKHNRKAVYVKCADRIHNLRTISVFPVEKQREKAYKTRTVIIPVARAFHIHKLADELANLCFEIDNPEMSRRVGAKYRNILKQNSDTLYGKDGVIETAKRLVLRGGVQSDNVVSFDFIERSEDDIFSKLTGMMDTAEDLERVLTKKNVPLFDVFLITSDLSQRDPEDIFFSFYTNLHTCRYHFTITEIEYPKYREQYCYIMEDAYGTKYRLHIQSETQHLEYDHGILVADVQDFRNGLSVDLFNEGGTFETKMIPVFKKDGTSMLIEDGATVLDFAFAIDRNIGICAKYALINGKMEKESLRRKLRAGDQIEIISDHDKHRPERDIPHATVRWFEYVYTREAIRFLSRWLEKHMDSGSPTMVVQDGSGKEYEIEMAATVLDFAFAVDEEVGLHLQKAYVNGCKEPTQLGKTLRYGDKVMFEYDIHDKETPVFNWLNLVKTKKARERLVRYFDANFHRG